MSLLRGVITGSSGEFSSSSLCLALASLDIILSHQAGGP